MRTRTIVYELTREELVNLFSTALYGDAIFSVDYNHNVEGDCIEDKIATNLINGNSIKITDNYSEDGDDAMGNLPHEIDEDGQIVYELKLTDIFTAIQNILDCRNTDDETRELKNSVTELASGEDCDWDYCQANNLLQYILFGEIVYG